MWALNPYAPDMPAWPRLAYIEACYRIALYDWLISWAEWVETDWQQHFDRYPFASGPTGIWVTLALAREALAQRMSDPDAASVVAWVTHDIEALANILASARGMPVRTSWDTTGLGDLTYVGDLLKCEP